MQILVTGGTGYLGSALVRTLTQRHTVRVLVRNKHHTASLQQDPVEIVEGDVRNRKSLKTAVAGCEAVFHLAALVKTWVPEESLYEAVNVEGFRNLAEVSWEEGVKRFVYTSSFLALEPTDQDSKRTLVLNPYEASKKKALRLARDYQKKAYPLVTVIPTVLYGPGVWTDGNHMARLLKKLLLGKFPGWIDGGRWRWNFAYVEDVAEGEQLVLEQGKIGEEYVLGGETVSLRDFFTLASETAGCPVPTREIPLSFLKVHAAFQEFLARIFSREPSLTRGILETYRHDWDFRDEKAREALGYTSTPLKGGLVKTIAWLRNLP